MSTKKITLYDPDKDVAVETYLTAEDAKRANADMNFAAELLRRAINNGKKATSPTTNNFEDSQDEEIDEDVTMPDESTENSEETAVINVSLALKNQEDEVSLCRWTPPCVYLLLETYRSKELLFDSGKVSQKKIWGAIAKELKRKGYNVTGDQCSTKLKNLKKTYKAAYSKPIDERRNWQFFEVMEEMFGKKTRFNPVASSSGVSSKQSKSNGNSLEMDNFSKSEKPTIISLLGRILKQKEEHELRKMKRHRERMEIDEKYLSVLQKIADSS